MATNNYPESVSVRLPRGSKSKIRKKAKDLKTPSPALLREIIEAFLDDRLTITPDPSKETLYR